MSRNQQYFGSIKNMASSKDLIQITERLRQIPLTEERAISTNRPPYVPRSVEIPSLYQTHPEALNKLSPLEQELFTEYSQALANQLITRGDLDSDMLTFWELNGYDPSLSTPAAEVAASQIQFVEAYLGLKLTGNLDRLVKNFRRKYYTLRCLDSHDTNFCWEGAIIRNDVSLVERIFRATHNRKSNITPPTEEQIEWGLDLASTLGYPRLVQLLIYFLSPSNNSRLIFESISWAMAAGYIQTTQILLTASNGANGDRIFRIAIDRGYLDGVKIFFPFATNDEFLSYLNTTAHHGNFEIFKFLFPQLEPNSHLWTLAIDLGPRYILSAAQTGSGEFLEYLFQIFPGIPSILKKAAKIATENDNSSGLSYLIPHLDPVRIQKLYRIAIENGSIECLQLLISSSPPSNSIQLLTEFVSDPDDNNERPTETIDLLLSVRPLSPEETTELFNLAAKEKQLHLVTKLLELGELTVEEMISVLQSSEYEIVAAIAPYIPPAILDSIFVDSIYSYIVEPLIPFVSSDAINQKLLQYRFNYLADRLLPRATSIDSINTAFGYFIQLVEVSNPKKIPTLRRFLGCSAKEPCQPRISEANINSAFVRVLNSYLGLELLPFVTSKEAIRERFRSIVRSNKFDPPNDQFLKRLIPQVSPEDINGGLETISNPKIFQVLLPFVTSESALESEILNLFSIPSMSLDFQGWNIILERLSSEGINRILAQTRSSEVMSMLVPRATDTQIITNAFFRLLTDASPIHTQSDDLVMDAFLGVITPKDINQGIALTLESKYLLRLIPVATDLKVISESFLRIYSEPGPGFSNQRLIPVYLYRVSIADILYVIDRRSNQPRWSQNGDEIINLLLSRLNSDTEEIKSARRNLFLKFVSSVHREFDIRTFNLLFGCPLLNFQSNHHVVGRSADINPCIPTLSNETINSGYEIATSIVILEALLPYTTSSKSRGRGLIQAAQILTNDVHRKSKLIDGILSMGVDDEFVLPAIEYLNQNRGGLGPLLRYQKNKFGYQFLSSSVNTPDVLRLVLDQLSDPLAISIAAYSKPELVTELEKFNLGISQRLQTIYSPALTQVLYGIAINDKSLIQSIPSTMAGPVVDEMVSRGLFVEITELMSILGQVFKPNEEALIWAVQIGSRGLVQYLLRLQTRPDYKDWTAMQLAQHLNRTDLYSDLYLAGQEQGLIPKSE